MTTSLSLTPIARQPTTNLALVCRYLTGPELIACYQTNHLLSAAASHPLTFQQETKVGVITELNQCRFYANGPTAVFRTSQQMRRAFQSRLFKHFRIVHLKVKDESQLQDYILALTEPNTPSLQAITITLNKKIPGVTKDPVNSTFDPSSNSNELISDYSNAPSLKYLTAVHIINFWEHSTKPALDSVENLIRFLPLSTEIFHLTVYAAGRVVPDFMNTLVNRLLLPSNRIKQLIVDVSGSETTTNGLAELSRLHEQSRNIDSLAIHWNVPIVWPRLESNRMKTLGQLKLTQIETIQLSGVTEDESWLNRLLPFFPNLKRCTIKEISVDLGQTKLSTDTDNLPTIMNYPVWPTTLQQSLEELSLTFHGQHFPSLIPFLIQAKLSHLKRLDLDNYYSVGFGTSFQELFESMPQLTRLNLNNFTVDKLDDFAFAPNLVSLYSLEWPTTIPYSCTSWAHIFPSLQTLSVVKALESMPTIYSDLLNTVPNLRHLKWRQLPWIHPNEINKRAEMEAERVKRDEAQREADLRESEERLQSCKEKAIRMAASIAAITPSADALRSFFSRLDYTAKVETTEETAERLRRTHLTPTKPTTATSFIPTEPFVLTPQPTPTSTNPMNDSTFIFTSSQLTSPTFSFNSTPFSLTSSAAPATSSTSSSTQPTPTSTIDPNPFSLLTPPPSLSTSASVFNTPTSTSSLGVGGFSSLKKVVGGGRKSASGHRTTSVGHQSITPSTAPAASSAFVFQASASTVDVSSIAPVTNPFAPPSFENSSSTTATNAPSFSAVAFSFPIITPQQ